jgi:hypothetical protein
MKCEDCKDGYVILLTTRVKCDTCNGKGFIPQINVLCANDEDEYYPLSYNEDSTQLELPWWHYMDSDGQDSCD